MMSEQHLLCCHMSCPVHEDVEIPVGQPGPYYWYCREHRGMTEFQPKQKRRDDEDDERQK